MGATLSYVLTIDNSLHHHVVLGDSNASTQVQHSLLVSSALPARVAQARSLRLHGVLCRFYTSADRSCDFPMRSNILCLGPRCPEVSKVHRLHHRHVLDGRIRGHCRGCVVFPSHPRRGEAANGDIEEDSALDLL